MRMNRSSGLPASRFTLSRGWRKERVTVVLTGEGSDETLGRLHALCLDSDEFAHGRDLSRRSPRTVMRGMLRDGHQRGSYSAQLREGSWRTHS